MNTLRLSASALAVSVVLAVAWMLGSGGCSGPDIIYQPNCFVPTPTETGADGGPDPCHCNLKPPLAPASCPCTSTEPLAEGETGMQVFLQCMALLPADAGNSSDAGDAAEGGPLPACNGECVALPPPDWTPVWLGSGDAGSCPDAAPALVFAGNAYDAIGTFAIGCSSTASGSCPGLGKVCGPGPLDDSSGFQLCVMHEGDVPCVSVGPQPAYPAWSLFYEGTPPEPIQPFTFCCIPTLVPPT